MLAPTNCGFLRQGHLENGNIKTISIITGRDTAKNDTHNVIQHASAKTTTAIVTGRASEITII